MDLPNLSTFPHATTGHIAAVLTLDPPERESMLAQAERERWSVRELQQHVVGLRRDHGERRGRPPVEAENRAIGLLESGVRLLKNAVDKVETVVSPTEDTSPKLGPIADELSALSPRVWVLS